MPFWISLPTPVSYTSWLVHVAPSSSDHAIHISCSPNVGANPHAEATFEIGSPAIQATYTRPALGPDCTTLTATGSELQIDSTIASGDSMAICPPNVLPPS